MSKNLHHIVILLIFSCLICQQLKAQIDFPASLNPADLQPEEILLTTDRNVYVTGEDIYFSVFISGADQDHTKQPSKVIYVELYNHENSAVIRQKLPIESGKAEGNIHIKGDLRTGRYYIRAFTQYSHNFLPAAYAIEQIDIINPDLPAQLTQEKTSELILYPEFGRIFPGVENEIAFKVNRLQNNDIDSILLLEDSLSITSKTSFYLDAPYGYFSIFPQENSTYTLKFYFSSGDSISTTLNIEPENEVYINHAVNNEQLILEAHGESIHTENIQLDVYTAAGININKVNNLFVKERRAEISTNSLHPGLNFFVFRTNENDPVSTIAVYKEFPDPVEVDLKLTATEFGTRKPVTLTAEMPAKFNDTAMVSISVVKEGTAEIPGDLSGFLTENIFLIEPFNLTSDLSRQQLKIALLIYNSKLSESKKKINFAMQDSIKLWLPDTRDISISGYLRDKNTGEPLADVPVISSLLFDSPQIHISRTNNDGVFLFSFYELYGTKEIFISPLDNANQQEILINNEYAVPYPDIEETYSPPDSSNSAFLDELYLNAQLNQIYFPFMQSELPAAPDIFGDKLSYVYPDKYIDLPSLQDIFNEIIPYARIRISKDGVKFGIFNTLTAIWSDNPLIMLDNAPVTDPEKLLEIHPAEILKVGILTNTYLTGDQFLPGLILIYTKSGQFGGVEFPDNAVFLEYQMYSRNREFSAPKYDDSSARSDNRPDFRNTLYWQPSLQIKDNKKVTFYTSDHISSYQIILRGKTEDGRTVIGKANFRVTP